MLVKPNWDIFKSKFSNDPEGYFEWFSYLLFCREFNLDKGWYGFKNQPAVEKEPIIVGDEVISFQSKFYQADLSKRKDKLIETVQNTRKHYPELTKLIFYTNQTWTLDYSKGTKRITSTQREVESLATSLGISIEWRTGESFFDSPFVCSSNADLASYFFENDDSNGWCRYTDWSSKKSSLNDEYYVDDNIKILSPNHDISKALTVIEGLNEIRHKLSIPSESIRLVGLSGVGKTKFAQALFDSRIGSNALDIRQVWYCDAGSAPHPKPQHFIEQLIKKEKRFFVIVDNCGTKLHAELTQSIDDSQISLLTIEYDVTDGVPEKTNVYRMQSTTTDVLKKVIKRHYPELDSINIDKIAEFSGGNYRLALALASNVGKVDNLSILTDEELFKRLFYQQGQLDEQALRVGQIFSLVFSFNVEDMNETGSEINILAELSEVTSRQAYRIIEELRQKDIVQKRGDFRAILPHALANNLAKQAISGMPLSELNLLLTSTPYRLQTSFLKRLSYLHDNIKVKDLVKRWFEPNGYFGQKILQKELDSHDYRQLSLFCYLCPDELLALIKEKQNIDGSFLSLANPEFDNLAVLIRNLAYYDRNFEKSFWLLLSTVTSDDDTLDERISSLFHLYLSRSEATLATRKRVIEDLYKIDDYHKYLPDIIDNGLGSQKRNIIIYDVDNGSGAVQTYGYQPKYYNEIWDWFEFLLNKLYLLDDLYPEQCRKILTDNIENIIWRCGRNDEVIKYVKLFHSKQPFTSALFAIKKLITYRKEFFSNIPEKRDELIKLSNFLEPDRQNISNLIDTYILSGTSWDYKRKLYSDGEDDYGLSINGFKDYDDLVEYIANNMNVTIINRFLHDLLTSSNSMVRQLGKSVTNIFPNIDDFIGELKNTHCDSGSKFNHFFLSEVAKNLVTRDWEGYQKLIEYLLSERDFSSIAPQVISEASRTQEQYEFAIEKMIEYPEVDFSCMGSSLISNRDYGNISPEVFEYVLDKLISINKDDVVTEILLNASLFNKRIDSKYHDKLLELLPAIINSKNYYDYSHALKLLLNYSKSTRQQVFKIVENSVKNMDYIFDLYNRPVGHVLEDMLKSSTSDFLNLIYDNEVFKPLYHCDRFKNILSQANEAEVLAWIDQDQDKIDFWFSHSLFYRNNGEGTIEWKNTLHELLTISQNPEINLTNLIEENILQVMSWSGLLSEEMKRRLCILDDLSELLKHHKLDQLLLIIDKSKTDYQRRITKVREKEMEESDRNQSFDW